MESLFLSLEEDQPLGIFYATGQSVGVVELDSFFKESLIDLTPRQAKRYAKRLKKFVRTLDELAEIDPK